MHGIRLQNPANGLQDLNHATHHQTASLDPIALKMTDQEPILQPQPIRHKSHLELGDQAPQKDQHVRVCVLASGSKGNAIYISNQSTSILIDAGLSGTQIVQRLQSRNIHPETLSGIVVTHEHSDHIQGVGVLSRRFGLPVYITRETHHACPRLGRLSASQYFRSGSEFHIEHLTIHPFSISHDASDPVGFIVSTNGIRIGVATDLGMVTGLVKTRLRNCDALVLEANHDPEMLINGPYPWPLKQRIQSRNGHLSNQDTRMLLSDLKNDRLKHVVLAHLSETNNSPQKVLNSVTAALNGCDVQIEVARQDRCSKLIRL